jgi:two-component system sensor histidine kinase KdpD
MSQKPDLASDRFDETRELIHRQMLSAVSHDLKTPLATMIGSLEVFIRMKEKLSPEKQAALIQSALTEAYRLDNFITNILDMAKLEGGMVQVKPQRYDLASLLQDSLTRLGPGRDKGTIQIRQIGNNDPIYTDPMLLGRAASLLMENALKHAGKNPEILLEYGTENGRSFIRVSDNGPGIPLAMQASIFSKYTRLSKTDQQNAGTGLGLAICQNIMRALGGEVRVANQPRGGAVFTLTFPSSVPVAA